VGLSAAPESDQYFCPLCAAVVGVWTQLESWSMLRIHVLLLCTCPWLCILLFSYQ
jgi:hypothetical protein